MRTRPAIFYTIVFFLLLPVYFLKVLPVVGKRYALSNRRLMVQRGLTRKVSHEIALADIDDVRVVTASQNGFFRSATLEVVSKGQVALKLDGVPEPETFRRAIVNAYKAWVPGRANEPIIPASATK